jgi:hypothetical protein
MLTVTFDDEISSILNTVARKSNVQPEKLLIDWIRKSAEINKTVNCVPTESENSDAFTLFTAISNSEKFTIDSACDAFSI